MGVQYACPVWLGDSIFDLKETNRIVRDRCKLPNKYLEPFKYTGYNLAAAQIQDNTDVNGYFQTEKYFSPNTRSWFQFKSTYPKLDGLNESTSLHIRFGDYEELRHVFLPATLDYYRSAMEATHATRVIVFSDELDKAKELLSALSEYEFNYDTGLSDDADLYYMSRCRDNIICNSSFSWWGAWLNPNPLKIVTIPKNWFHPKFYAKNNDIVCDTWIPI